MRGVTQGSWHNMASPKIIVAAIDFGTTYSGWAFSFNHEFESDPTKVTAKTWTGGSLVSEKGPTCVLINPDTLELDSFGYEAENKYAELCDKKVHKEWFYFKQFKMMLFGKVGMQRNIMLSDETGNELPAKTVFSLAIAHLKDDMMKMSRGRITGEGLAESEVHWVITVPAIWNEAAKQFMREAATEAGIDNEQLVIALEPEAASLYCRHLPVEKTKGENSSSLATFKPGTKYMILDAGGGTVDITVHEVVSGGCLKEIRKASGGAWGGTKVDKAFTSFLEGLFTRDVMKRFKMDHMDDYIDLFRDFEVKKRDVQPTKEGNVVVRIPASLKEVFVEMTRKQLKNVIAGSEYSDRVTLDRDKMKVDCSIFRSFFTEAVDSILDHVENLLQEKIVGKCAAIVMVGGFSESHMLFENVRRSFKNMRVICPDDAGLAVLKGAVIYGHSPTTIVARVCKKTYGVATSRVFEQGDPEVKKFVAGGKARCRDLFDVHVQINETVNIGEAQAERTYRPVDPDQTEMLFTAYATSSPRPRFVTDVGCVKLGSFTIDTPDTTGGLDREVKARMIFGGTEIEIETEDLNTGAISKARVNFLS